jgi:hypothetical protein
MPGLGNFSTPMAADREVNTMGIGVSLFLLAIGAILAFAVDVTTEGFNLNTMGIILMIVGGVGLLFSMLFWGSWGANRREEHIVTREREVL